MANAAAVTYDPPVGPIGIGSAFASGLSWAAVDAARKRLVRELEPAQLLFWLTLGQLPGYAIWAVLEGDISVTPTHYAPFGATALAINIAANLLFLRAVQVSPLSATIPMLALTPAATALIAWPLLGEVPRAREGVGIALVVLGTLGTNAGSTAATFVRDIVRERGALYMAAVAVLWSFNGAVDKLALEHAAVALHASVQAGGIAVAMLLWLTAGPGGGLGARRARQHAGGIALCAGLATLAMGFQLFAFRLVFVSFVEAIKRALGSLLSVVVGRITFGEAISARKLLAIAVASAGVFLLVGT